MKDEWVAKAHAQARARSVSEAMADSPGEYAERFAVALLAAAEADGFKLLPREATEEMEHAGAATLDHPSVYMGGPSRGSRRKARKVLAAMHDAAPAAGGEHG